MEGETQRLRLGRAGAVVALAAALAALVIIAVTFRGLVFITLPLAIAGLLLGVVGGRRADLGRYYAVAMVGVALAAVATLLSVLALAANILISRDYSVYDISGLQPLQVLDERFLVGLG